MQPVKIVIRDVENSPALEEHLRRKAEKLSHYYNHINNIHIVVEVPQKHKRNGKLFNVRIDLSVPGKELVVNRKLDEDVYVAVRDAFDALLRQLETYSRKRRGDIKNHDNANFGHVTRIFPQEGYGFILSLDGNELYFSNTNVTHPSFEQLVIGDPVQFLGITGPEGWQAHRVTKEKKSTMAEELDYWIFD
ncbi:MAG: ribosome-associated translation inhibitor RaiA [Pseudomonadota bacterium]